MDDAVATLKTAILSKMIERMPPASYDYLERATDAVVEALQDGSISWALHVIGDNHPAAV